MGLHLVVVGAVLVVESFFVAVGLDLGWRWPHPNGRESGLGGWQEKEEEEDEEGCLRRERSSATTESSNNAAVTQSSFILKSKLFELQGTEVVDAGVVVRCRRGGGRVV